MIRFFKNLFKGKDPGPAPEAPYKVEAPRQPDVDAKASIQIKCGCGRSPSGFCVGLHGLTPAEWATHPENPHATKEAPAKKRPVKKREDDGVAKVAPVKPKPKAPAKPRAKKPTK